MSWLENVYFFLSHCFVLWLFLLWNMFILSYFSDKLTSLVFIVCINRADAITTNRPLIVALKASLWLDHCDLILVLFFYFFLWYNVSTLYKLNENRNIKERCPRRKPTLLFILWLRSWMSCRYVKSSHIIPILSSESKGSGWGYQTRRWVTETPNKRKMNLMTHIYLMYNIIVFSCCDYCLPRCWITTSFRPQNSFERTPTCCRRLIGQCK